MWISRKEYRDLRQRLSDLEDAVHCPAAYSDTKIGRLMNMVLDHLGLHVQRTLQHDKLAKKGGPERGE